MKKTVIITGGRNYNDFQTLATVLDYVSPTIIVQGGANGADKLARDYASNINKEIWILTYEAEWNKYGLSAGPKRNIKMLEEHLDAIVIAFPGGKGTANCIKEALKRNMIVLEVK